MKICAFLGLVFCFLSASPCFSLTNSQPSLEAQFNASAFITTLGYDQDQSVCPGYCNATVLDASTLVTAAHCVSQGQALNMKQTTVALGQYKFVHRPDGQTVRVGYATVYQVVDNTPRFEFLPSALGKIQSEGAGAEFDPAEDIALIRLTKPLPLAQYAYVTAAAATPQEWQEFQSNPTAHSPTVVAVNPIAWISTTDVKRDAVLNDLSFDGSALESQSTARVEEGDSGSPIYAQFGGSWKLVAVTKGLAQSIFSNYDVFCPSSGALEQLLAQP